MIESAFLNMNIVTYLTYATTNTCIHTYILYIAHPLKYTYIHSYIERCINYPAHDRNISASIHTHTYIHIFICT